MSYERFRNDLEIHLREQVRLQRRAAEGGAVEALHGAEVERLQELTSDSSIEMLWRLAREAAPGDPRWWALERMTREAANLRADRMAPGLRRRWTEMTLAGGAPHAFADVATVLGRERGARAREALELALGDAAGAAGGLVGELLEAERAARSRLPATGAAWESARGRAWAGMVEAARRLLEGSDEPYAAAVAHARARCGLRPGRVGPVTDLPALLAGHAPGRDLPDAGRQLLHYLLAGLELERRLVDRLELRLVDPPRLHPRGGVYVHEPGARVELVVVRRGAMHDYAALLGGVGAAAGHALVDEPRGVDRRLRDPALSALFGALFEDLTGEPDFLGHALRRTPPASWLAVARVRLWLRLRLLAATVLAAGSDQPPAGGLPTAVAATEAERATGFQHPEGVLPWSLPAAAAADELAGRLLAVPFAERLATGFGRRWSGTAAAGRLLRELWAGGGHGNAGQLIHDLGLEALSPEPLLEVRPPAF